MIGDISVEFTVSLPYRLRSFLEELLTDIVVVNKCFFAYVSPGRPLSESRSPFPLSDPPPEWSLSVVSASFGSNSWALIV